MENFIKDIKATGNDAVFTISMLIVPERVTIEIEGVSSTIYFGGEVVS